MNFLASQKLTKFMTKLRHCGQFVTRHFSEQMLLCPKMQPPPTVHPWRIQAGENRIQTLEVEDVQRRKDFKKVRLLHLLICRKTLNH